MIANWEDYSFYSSRSSKKKKKQSDLWNQKKYGKSVLRLVLRVLRLVLFRVPTDLFQTLNIFVTKHLP